MKMWDKVALLTGPVMALVYAMVAAVFLPCFRECPWMTHMPAVVPRLTLLAAVVANCFGNNGMKENISWWLIVFAVTVAVSVHAVVQTRIHVVQGGVAPVLGDMTGRLVVITGANQGIGKETARLLVQQGATVVMACRSITKAQAAKEELCQGNHAVAERRVHVIPLDLSSLASVREAAEIVKQRFGKIHVLINNAGVMMSQQSMTTDGYDMVMQANHLGHYLWTRLLLNRMAVDGRILCLTSSTYSYAGRIDLEDLNCTKGRRTYSLFGQYAQSKLANIMFVQELARRYPTLFCAAVHPGLVRTDVVRHMAWYLRWPNQIFAAAVAALQKTPTQGAWCSAFLASTGWKNDSTMMSDANGSTSDISHSSNNKAPSLGLPNGQYWVNQRVQNFWPCAQDKQGAKQLWIDSERYVHLTGKH